MKLSKHAWTIWGILLVVSLVLMVLIPFSRTASWWIAAICTVLMFLLAAWTFYAAFRKDGLESKILGWPIFKVGAVALAVQGVLGFALMGLAALCPAWVTVLAEVLIFAVTGICLTVKDAARVVVSQSEAHMADSTAAWKVIRQKANALAASGDADMKRLAEEIRFTTRCRCTTIPAGTTTTRPGDSGRTRIHSTQVRITNPVQANGSTKQPVSRWRRSTRLTAVSSTTAAGGMSQSATSRRAIR